MGVLLRLVSQAHTRDRVRCRPGVGYTRGRVLCRPGRLCFACVRACTCVRHPSCGGRCAARVICSDSSGPGTGAVFSPDRCLVPQ
eukprot:8586336-Pyramimonas_sp.AAC.1